ncbi:hypothetical protein THAOC_33622 [Thalassiosira oceanica]|uniref:Uncharacterized protein n=1 Tax=Thalassiosira oceanica TaxID=159749 RepID=K0R3V0_THAOC|nr:hypothetical protein THAOC_33622 [Thalassiosira oceanica]|eukprot:EJK47643.1 hypothetical protein THAOC_33622 [Thalassiosira oceanica]
MTTINGVPINFDESWDTGIGGGLWTTGRAMGRYFDQNVSAVIANIESLVQVKGGRLAAIELGAGNGFLSVCLMALLQGHQHLVEVLNVTDLSDHLGLITKTVLANSHVWSKLKVLAPDHGKEEIYEGNLEGSTTVQVQAHEWGTTDGSEKKYDQQKESGQKGKVLMQMRSTWCLKVVGVAVGWVELLYIEWVAWGASYLLAPQPSVRDRLLAPHLQIWRAWFDRSMAIVARRAASRQDTLYLEDRRKRTTTATEEAE